MAKEHFITRETLLWSIGIFSLALLIRSLSGYFIHTHIDDAGCFPFGIYAVFDNQAQGILDGKIPFFWITDPVQTEIAIYPPGYSYWLAIVYFVTGVRSTVPVQIAQVVLDSASVLLIYGIAATAFNKRIAIGSGSLAALSPLLAVYGASPLADAPTSWLVLGGVWLLVIAVQNQNWYWALGAGLMVGASCWIRANGVLLAVVFAGVVMLGMTAAWRTRAVAAVAILIGTFVVVAPVVIRNSVAFGTFVPAGLGAGTNLWEGIGETSRAAEFGAVYGDEQLIDEERVEMGRPNDETITLYSPEGVARDRRRMQKALSVITEHPFWYATVMMRRMVGLVKYVGEDSPFYGSTGFHVTPARCLPPALGFFPLNAFVKALGMIQSVYDWLALPLMLCGLWFSTKENRRITLVVASVVFYYMVVGTFMHVEIRYTLAMQAVLVIFAGVGVVGMIDLFYSWRNDRKRDAITSA